MTLAHSFFRLNKFLQKNWNAGIVLMPCKLTTWLDNRTLMQNSIPIPHKPQNLGESPGTGNMVPLFDHETHRKHLAAGGENDEALIARRRDRLIVSVVLRRYLSAPRLI